MIKATQNNWIKAAILFLLIASFIFPEKLWGIHYFEFSTPFIQGLTLLLFCLGYIFHNTIFEYLEKLKTGRVLTITLSFLISFLIFKNIHIAADFYGNSRGFLDIIDTTTLSLPADFWSDFFEFDIKPGQGRNSVKSIIQLTSYITSLTIRESFILLDAICGGLFISVFNYYINKEIRNSTWKTILKLIGFSSPILLVFFGHIETYAIVFLLFFCLSILAIKIKNKPKYWAIFIPIFLLAIKIHTLTVLILPSILFQYINLKNTSIKRVFFYSYILLLGLGALLYFFVFEGQHTPRRLTNFEDIDRLFLPLYSPEAPLDNYNIFSWNHILDFLNIIIFWSPSLILFFLLLFNNDKSKINLNDSKISASLLSFLIYGTFLFCINPLFSLPMDWDLFMMPVPFLFVFLVQVVKNIEHEKSSHHPYRTILAFTFLSIPTFFVYTNQNASSQRIESVGKHIFKTYYEHASTYILYALNLKKPQTLDEYLDRKENIINELEPFTNQLNDWQYTDLLIDQGLTILNSKNNIKEARYFLAEAAYFSKIKPTYSKVLNQLNRQLQRSNHCFTANDSLKSAELKLLANQSFETENTTGGIEYLNRAQLIYPVSGDTHLQLLIQNFKLQQFNTAYNEALTLIQLEYPSTERAYKIAIHTSLEAEKYSKTKALCEYYIKEFGQNQTVKTVLERINRNDNLNTIKLLFKQK